MANYMKEEQLSCGDYEITIRQLTDGSFEAVYNNTSVILTADNSTDDHCYSTSQPKKSLRQSSDGNPQGAPDEENLHPSSLDTLRLPGRVVGELIEESFSVDDFTVKIEKTTIDVDAESCSSPQKENRMLVNNDNIAESMDTDSDAADGLDDQNNHSNENDQLDQVVEADEQANDGKRKVVTAVRKSKSRRSATIKQRRKKHKDNLPVHNAYSFRCTKCCAESLVLLSPRALRCELAVFDKESIPIFCSTCNANGTGTLKVTGSSMNACKDIFLLRCVDPKCSKHLFSTFRMLLQHITQKHAEWIAKENPLESKKEAAESESETETKVVAKYICPVIKCVKTFQTAGRLKRHKECHKAKGGGCRCKGCVGEIPPLTVLNRVPKRPPHDFTCTLCDASFTIRMNVDSAYVANGFHFVCPSCHNPSTSSTLVMCAINKPSSKDLRFLCSLEECPMRQKPFKKMGKLTEHERIHSDEMVLCEACGERLRRAQKKRHILNCKAQIKLINCMHCNVQCRNLRHLKEHVRKVHGPRSNENLCEECGVALCNFSNLKRHIMSCHGSEESTRPAVTRPIKEYKATPCQVCGKVFGSQRQMKQHASRTHKSADKTCKDCGRLFKTTDQMNRHRRRMHSAKDDARLIKCEHCLRGFFFRTELKKHVRFTHEGVRLECQHCGKKFKSKLGLQGHISKKHAVANVTYVVDER